MHHSKSPVSPSTRLFLQKSSLLVSPTILSPVHSFSPLFNTRVGEAGSLDEKEKRNLSSSFPGDPFSSCFPLYSLYLSFICLSIIRHLSPINHHSCNTINSILFITITFISYIFSFRRLTAVPLSVPYITLVPCILLFVPFYEFDWYPSSSLHRGMKQHSRSVQ